MTVLATKRVSGNNYGRRVDGVAVLNGSLHFIRSNDKPYFSVTLTVHRLGRPDQVWLTGAADTEIDEMFPVFTDLKALHLSDIDGVPMHAVANGLYKIAGAMGGFGQRYHLGNQKMNFADGYRCPTEDECRAMAKKHFRCTDEQIDMLIGHLKVRGANDPEKVVAEFVDHLRPTWKEEADALIAKYGLVVEGAVAAWEERRYLLEIGADIRKAADEREVNELIGSIIGSN